MIKTAELDYKPKFVLAHLLIPHPPYVFGSNGEAILPESLSLEDKDNFELYFDQLEFTNKKIQEVVEKLTATEHPPIIIIQSDHSMKVGSRNAEYE